MTKCGIDFNLYFWQNEGEILRVMLYVDDLVLIGNNDEKIAWLKRWFEGEFKMMDLAQLGRYLGINFTFTKEGMFLFQKPYLPYHLFTKHGTR
jgi:hypothetical protein